MLKPESFITVPAGTVGVSPIYHSTVARLHEQSDIAVKANVTAIDILNARVTEAFDDFRALFAAPAAPSATSVTPASVITDPGTVVDEVDTVRREVAEVEREPSVVAARTTASKAAVTAAKAGRRPTAHS